MNGNFGKKSNKYQVTPGAGSFGKKSKFPNQLDIQPKKEIEEILPDSNESATTDEIDLIEETMNTPEEKE
jgi:hypothetical protein